MKKLTNTFVLTITLLFASSIQAYSIEINVKPENINKEIDHCAVKGLFYTVQLGVFSKPVIDESFPSIAKPIYCIKRADGLYSYFAGIFDSRFAAMEKRFDVVSKGLHDAYVAVYYEGKQISMPEADQLLADHGTAILYNAEAVEDNFTQKP